MQHSLSNRFNPFHHIGKYVTSNDEASTPKDHWSESGIATPILEDNKAPPQPAMSKLWGPLSHLQVTRSTHSTTSSSCELFGVFKLLAAGQADSLVDKLRSKPTESGSNTPDSVEDLAETAEQVTIGQSSEGQGLTDTPPDLHALDSSLQALSEEPHTGSLPHDSPQEESTEKTAPASDKTDEEKVAAIIEEFGSVTDLLSPPDGETAPEPERILAEAKGSLFRGVMLNGHLHLTNYRLLFHAYLPPNIPSAANSAQGSDTQSTGVLMSGPVTWHSSSSVKSPRRVWMEITSDMISVYPRSDEAGRVRPLRCIMLSSIRRLEPMNDKEPCEFHLEYETPEGRSRKRFTVDMESSAMHWRRILEAALFRLGRRHFEDFLGNNNKQLADEIAKRNSEWSMMRTCMPLDRISIRGVSDYHNYVTLVALAVSLSDKVARPHWLSDNIVFESPFRTDADLEGSAIAKPTQRSKTSILPRGVTVPIARIGSPKPPRSSTLPPKGTDRNTHNSQPGSPARSGSPMRTQSSRSGTPNSANLPPIDDAGIYAFKVAVLNKWAWFTEALVGAVEASQSHRYKDPKKRALVTVQVGDHDCLATDDEWLPDGQGNIPPQRMNSNASSNSNHEDDSSEDNLPARVHKAEVAALASSVFGFSVDEDVWVKRCYLAQRTIAARGHLLLTLRFLCFWRRAGIGADLKYRFRLSDIQGVDEADASRPGFVGLLVHIDGQPDLKLEFWQQKSRTEVAERIRKAVAHQGVLGAQADTPLPPTPPESSTLPVQSSEPLQVAQSSKQHAADILAYPRSSLSQPITLPDQALAYMPFIANMPSLSQVKLAPRHFVCLTIGSRGDIQPYIALGLRLQKDGHKVTIVTHDEFKTWIEGYGIHHRQAGGDPTALMKLSTEHKMFSPGFFKESLGSFRQWLDDLLLDSWRACSDADVLIESPSTMAGIHIAESRRIPYFRAFTMPWTRTSAYPQAFMVPAFDMGPSFNYSTYVLFDNIMWRATSGQINRWRKKYLNLQATDMSTLSISKVPFLYNFSSAVVPKPLDWHDNISITGYWNLEDSDTEWSPTPELEEFLAAAKRDGKPIVYIGFGSIVVPKPNAVTRHICNAVEQAGVRAIIAKGWSSRGAAAEKDGDAVEFPPSCFPMEKVPHGWLFPKINAAMHHGGAGTVGASLRAGIPTIIKPWFGDQYFWALRVTKLGAGMRLSSLRSDDITDALTRATTDKVMIEKAAAVGRRIRTENGVDNAVQAIQFNISRAAENRNEIQWAS